MNNEWLAAAGEQDIAAGRLQIECVFANDANARPGLVYISVEVEKLFMAAHSLCGTETGVTHDNHLIDHCVPPPICIGWRQRTLRP